MSFTKTASTQEVLCPDPDALLCALVLAPHTYARNRFFQLFEQPSIKRVRRRAKRVRGIIRQLLGQGREPAEVVGEQVMEDRVLLRFQVSQLNYQRTTSLTLLEAALIHFALGKSHGTPVAAAHRTMVEEALAKLNRSLNNAHAHSEVVGLITQPDSVFPDSLPLEPASPSWGADADPPPRRE